METTLIRQAEQLRETFVDIFGVMPRVFYAPGRVNLIGEHTDYNDGFVLPCAINYHTVVAASLRSDNHITVQAQDMQAQQSHFTVQAIEHDTAQPWSNYVRGVVWALRQHLRGADLPGLNLLFTGNVPQGAGLSSSAALEVAIGTALNSLWQLGLSPETIAKLGQQAENDFVGVNCGIMDQFISALGQQDKAVLIDCRSLRYQPVAMPADTAVVIVNSNIKRGLVDSAYNERRQQCQAAAAHFGVPALRDVSLEDFEAAQHSLAPELRSRARHVISENARTLEAAQTLASGDLVRMGQLMAASHASLRDDFAVSVPAIDALVAMIADVLGESGGVRLTGAGFGGCVVALMPKAAVDEVRARVLRDYPQHSGLEPDIYLCHAAAGAREFVNP